jgi:Domain of unknown function (DUF5667)
MRSRPSRRDVEYFADVVDGRAPSRRHALTSDRMRELVDVADLVRETSAPPTASREFVADLRASLMAAAADELTSTEPVRRRDRVVVDAPPMRRRLTAAAGAFVMVGGTLGLVSASAQAVPGDMLYPVKRATEDVELLIRDGAGEGRALLKHASARLDEVAALTDSDSREDLIADTLTDFASEADKGGSLLIDSYRDDGSSGDIEDLRVFLADSAERLENLADELPSAVAHEYADAAKTVSGLDTTAVTECPDCADGQPPLSVDTDLLQSVSYVLDSADPTTEDTTASDDSQLAHHRRPPAVLPPNALNLPPHLLDNDPLGDDQQAADNDAGTDSTTDGDGTDDGDASGTDSTNNAVDDVTDGAKDTTDKVTSDATNGLESLIEPIQKPLSQLLGGTLGPP